MITKQGADRADVEPACLKHPLIYVWLAGAGFTPVCFVAKDMPSHRETFLFSVSEKCKTYARRHTA